jgi:hypothetical protein
MILRCKPLLGTFVSLKTSEEGNNAYLAVEEALEEIEEIHNLMSFFDKESELTLLNQNAHKEPISVDPRLFEVRNKEINLRNQEKINEWIIKNGFEKRIKIIEIQEIEKKQNKKYNFNYCTECNYKNKKEIHKVCVEATNEKEAWKKIKKKYKEYENFRNIDFC